MCCVSETLAPEKTDGMRTEQKKEVGVWMQRQGYTSWNLIANVASSEGSQLRLACGLHTWCGGRDGSAEGEKWLLEGLEKSVDFLQWFMTIQRGTNT